MYIIQYPRVAEKLSGGVCGCVIELLLNAVQRVVLACYRAAGAIVLKEACGIVVL